MTTRQEKRDVRKGLEHDWCIKVCAAMGQLGPDAYLCRLILYVNFFPFLFFFLLFSLFIIKPLYGI